MPQSYARGLLRGFPLNLAGCSGASKEAPPKGRQPIADKKDASFEKKREASFLYVLSLPYRWRVGVDKKIRSYNGTYI
jgi:hypothetical protein